MYSPEQTGSAPIGASKSERIAHILEDEIRRGVLGRGDALESESALVRRFSVSRSTVRKSLEILSGKGLITTKSGIGSFVTFDGQILDDGVGWTLALAKADVELETQLLRLERGAMDLPCAALAPGADCLIVDRLRSAARGGQGVSLERSRVPWSDALGEVLRDGLVNGSLSATLGRHAMTVASGDEWANVVTRLSARDADLMRRPSYGPMLRVRRLTRMADGAVVEYVESLLDPDLFGLHMAF